MKNGCTVNLRLVIKKMIYFICLQLVYISVVYI